MAEHVYCSGQAGKGRTEKMKQKALVSGQAVTGAGGRLRREESGALLTLLCGCVLGFLLPRAAIGGVCAPFGVGLAAAARGRKAPAIGICTVLGYLTAFPATEAMWYALAVILTAGLRWVTDAVPRLKKSRILPPVLAGAALLLSGGLIGGTGGGKLIGAVLWIGGGVLAAGFCLLCTAAAQAERPNEAVGVIFAVALTAAATVEVGGLAPGRIFTLAAVLLLSRVGETGDGTVFGVLCCLFSALTAPTRVFYALTLAAAGWLGERTAPAGRPAQAILLLPTGVLCHALSGEGEQLLVGAYEALTAGVLLLIVPPAWEERLRERLAGRSGDRADSWQLLWHDRLDLAAGTLREMTQTVETVSEKLSALTGPTLSDVYAGLADSVCRHCPKKMLCWHTRGAETTDELNRLTPRLRESGRLDAAWLGGALADCPDKARLAEAVSAGYRAYRVREGAYARLGELRRGVTGQFDEVSGLLEEWADRAQESDAYDWAAARRVREVCQGHGLHGVQVDCRRTGGGLAVQLWINGAVTPGRQLLREIGAVCRQTFDEPVTVRTEGRTCVRLCPPPRFRVRIGTAQHSCGGAALCGDAVEQFADGNGRVTAILSDGMGSGGRAAVDGTMCAVLTERLLLAGFGADSALRLVNTALMVRAGEESLSTLDLLEVDVYSGDTVSRKAGAAASLLRSRGRVSRIEQTSLPVGILKEVRFAEYRDRLVDGDVLLLVSDGVYLGGSGWVEELLAAYPAKRPPQELAQAVVAEARRRAPAGREDDITAVAVQVEELRR